ncbi:hypothetical protein K7432_003504 [Basidiobolus ranarum]|uniref:Uncharacterized protein n=1 Tax=Basidiobolus ranarum TaxID=34480 RepID=A0ABR2W6E6_9FUNG
MSLIKAASSKLAISMTARTTLSQGVRMYSVQKQAVQVHQRDWMDADESHSFVQEAIRSVNEETISTLGERSVHKIGNYESQQEKPVKSVIRRDWLGTSEDVDYAQEAMRSVLQDTIYNPVGLNIHSFGSSIPFEQRSPAAAKQPLKADWLDAEDFHHATEAIRSFQSDTVNSLGQSDIHTTAQKLI